MNQKVRASIAIATALLFAFSAQSCAAQAHASHVATMAGTFDVSASGSATYTIPIRVAPGSAGTEPKISITYDSQAMGGALGAGWSIAGLSTITRGPRNLFLDNAHSGVRLDDTDALFLDGERLIAVRTTGVGASRTVEYRKAVDDTTRILQMGATLDTSRFRVDTKGGLRLYFDGANNSSVKLADGFTLVFAASRIVDTAGNYIEFRYSANGNGDYDVQSIRYTGHETRDGGGNVTSDRRPYASIEFEYENAPRPLDAYIAGRVLRKSTRLKSIQSRVSLQPDNVPAVVWSTVARYAFEYEDRDTANRFVLTRIREFGEDGGEIVPTTFAYSRPSIGWSSAQFQMPIIPFAQNERLNGAYRFAHFAPGAGAAPDLAFAAQVEGKLETFAFKNNGDGTWTKLDTFAPPFAFASEDGADLGALVLDVNGDGRVDLLQSFQRTGQLLASSAYVAGADGWQAADGYKLPFTLNIDGKTVTQVKFLRLSSKDRPDLLYDTGTARGYLRNTGTGWQRDDVNTPPIPLDAKTRYIDVDCDGKAEIVRPGSDGQGNPIWRIYQFHPDGWVRLEKPEFALPIAATSDPESIREIDLNADGCADLIVASGQGEAARSALFASKDGWKPAAGKTPPFDLVDAKGRPSRAVVVDIDGDGRPDVAAHRLLPDGSAIRFVFRQTGDGWEALTAAFVPPAISVSTADTSYDGAVLVDMNNDGLVDALVPSGARSSFGRVYAGTQQGFVEKADYVPPIAIARRDLQDRGVRFVDLNADGLPDVIYRKDLIKDGKTQVIAGALINTGHGWVAAAGLVPPLPFASETIAGNPVQFVDVDGDGYIDFLYSYRKSDGTVTRGYFRNESDGNGGRKWTEQVGSSLTPPVEYPFAAEGVGDTGVRLVDLDGDGRIDILAGRLPPADIVRGDAEICVNDPTGAQKCELNRTVFRTAAFLNDGKAWLPAPQYAPPVPFVMQAASERAPSSDLFVQIVDVDGDRLPDIVASFKHPRDNQKEVREIWLNTGAGWALSKYEIPTLLDAPLRDHRATFQWLDINGDGLADLVFTKREGNANASTTWLSTGRGFVKSDAWEVPTGAIADRGGDQGFRFMDVNGDGYLDIVYGRKLASGSIERGVAINTGAGWKLAAPDVAAAFPALIDANGVDQGVRFIDVDGNGLIDVVQAFASGPSSEVIERQVLLNTGRRSDVLDNIERGYGLKTSISYQSMLESPPDAFPWSRVYEPGTPTAYPFVAAIPASYVVRRVTVDEGDGRRSRSAYRYGGFTMHATAMRSLGFRWRESYDEFLSIVSRTEYAQDPRYGARPSRDAVCWLDPAKHPQRFPANLCPPTLSASDATWVRILSETSSTWKVTEGRVGVAALPVLTITRVQLASTSSTTFDLDGGRVSWQTDTFDYGSAGDILGLQTNLLKTRTLRGDGTSIDTTNEYAQDDESRWYLGRMTRTSVVVTGDPVGNDPTQRKSHQRAATFAYDPVTGLLVTESIEVGNVPAMLTEYQRDVRGNIVATTTTVPGEAPRVTKTEYDALGRLAVSRTNALGHRVRYTTRSTTGKVETITDANFLTTRFSYDPLGRLVKRVEPSGLVVSTAYLELQQLGDSRAAAGVTGAYAIRETVGELPAKIVIFDNRGRPVREINDGYVADATKVRPIHRDWVYDLACRVIATSMPYDRGSKPLWGKMSYDALGRLVRSEAADGTVASTRYASRPTGGRLVSVIDPLGRATRTETNMRGNPVNIYDAQGGRTQVIYGASDRVERVLNPGGIATTYEYNDLGYRTKIDDPDLGVLSYEYNGFGEVTREIDPKNQIRTYEYDVLGRLRQRVEPDMTTTFQYDTAPRGIGQLAATKRSDGQSAEYFYDAYARLAGTSATINGEQFVTRTDLDIYGRIVATYYPSDGTAAPFVSRNVYDKKGFLVKVTNATGTITYWTARAMDAQNRVTRESLANGVDLQRTYGTLTNQLDRLLLTRQNSGLVDLRLQYDATGNLNTRSDAVEGRRDSFRYDALDRLIQVTKADGSTDRFSYDPNGRLSYKTGVGDYVYSRAAAGGAVRRPVYAVQETRSGGTVNEYKYDANGNMESRAGLRLEYGSDNRLRTAYVDEANRATFAYAADGRLVRSYQRDGLQATETIYTGAYERITEYAGLLAGSLRKRIVRQRYYLSSPDGVFAAVEDSVQYLNPVFDPQAGTGNTAISRQNVWYLHKDELGSIIRITDKSGRVVAKFWFEAWGERKGRSYDPPGSLPPEQLANSWVRGLTGHPQIEQFALIHMNGRVYDIRLGQFVSADPAAVGAGAAQAPGRYRYAANNPLRYTDPTGYWDLGKGIVGGVIGFVTAGPGGAAVGFFVGANDDSRKWVEQNWRQVVIVGAAITVTVATGGVGAGASAAILSGMAAGAASGALSVALYGGSLDEVIAGAARGAVVGGISAGAFYGAGSAFSGAPGSIGAPDSLGAIAAHGAVGGGMESLQGGNFWNGFAAGAFTKASSAYLPESNSYALNVVRAAAVGGAVASMSGGNFANGAMTGAFSYAFNDAMHRSFNANKANEFFSEKYGGNKTTGYCARAVREALAACGVDVERMAYARDYGANLEAAGFKEVSTWGLPYVPQKGDIVVLQPPVPRVAGHIQMFTGTHWQSDFVQKRPFYPSTAYQSQQVPYKVYRANTIPYR